MTEIRVPDGDWKTLIVTILVGAVLATGGWLYTEQSARMERLQGKINSASSTSLDHERRIVTLEIRYQEIAKKLDQIHEDVKKLYDR